MYSILLVVKKPDAHVPKARDIYDEKMENLANIVKNKPNMKLLREGVLLLELNDWVPDLVLIVNHLESLPYTYTILTEDVKFYDSANDDPLNNVFS